MNDKIIPFSISLYLLINSLFILFLDHPDTAESYNNIGEAYRNKGEYDKAI